MKKTYVNPAMGIKEFSSAKILTESAPVERTTAMDKVKSEISAAEFSVEFSL